jgi:hypothetical protein
MQRGEDLAPFRSRRQHNLLDQHSQGFGRLRPFGRGIKRLRQFCHLLRIDRRGGG